MDVSSINVSNNRIVEFQDKHIDAFNMLMLYFKCTINNSTLSTYIKEREIS